MGQYGLYIWLAYGATAVIATVLVVRAVVDHRAQVAALARITAASPATDGPPDE